MLLTVGLSTDSVLNLPQAGLSPETGGRVFMFEGLAQTYPQPDIIRRGFCCVLLSLDCIRSSNARVTSVLGQFSCYYYYYYF